MFIVEYYINYKSYFILGKIMTVEKRRTLDNVLARLMQTYRTHVPDVEKIISLMKNHTIIASDTEIENDHIAFRTLGVPHLGIASLEKIFLHYGYEKRDYYYFAEKKLDAYWYAPPEPHYPRIFISELRVGELSSEAQNIIYSYTNQITTDPTENLNLDNAQQVGEFLHKSLWDKPFWEDYHILQSESEYASWVMYNRYYLNHFTISIHNLPEPYNKLQRFNRFLQDNHIMLNDSGGVIKISEDGYLSQSSTIAQSVSASFPTKQGDSVIKNISGSYIEFAQRDILPEFLHLPKEAITRKHRREGFETRNADSIFESTYNVQTSRQMV